MEQDYNVGMVAVHFNDGTIQTITENFSLMFVQGEGIRSLGRINMSGADYIFFALKQMENLGKDAGEFLRHNGFS